MNILIASSEVTPFAKTGGLADVCGTLPVALSQLGANPVVVMPAFHQHIHRAGVPIHETGLTFDVPIGSKVVLGRVLRSHLPGSEVPVYFVDQREYFDRAELYREKGADYKDNCERFAFFSRAVMELIRLLELRVDVLHCNDWQTGLVPAYLRHEYRHAHGYEHIVSLMTIHNLAYQGRFWHWDMLLTGLDWKLFNWKQMEFYGDLNLLKTGIIFADTVNTVSQRYSEEIQTTDLGCGLEGVLQQRSDVLSGIINGVDYSVWNPAHDPLISRNYTEENCLDGKAVCKAALQAAFNLPPAPRTPVIGFIGRLADQKGCDLVADVMKRWLRQVDAQWIVLGTGEPQYHEMFASLARDFPDRIGLKLEFSEKLAHVVEAGADIFLMPSRYEPCGLNQLYSLKYGTVPVVRETGGLADTVRDLNPDSLARGTATGFTFIPYDPLALEESLRRAVDVYTQQPDVWAKLVTNGMRQDWSWKNSAQRYLNLYSRMIARREVECAKVEGLR